MMDNRPLDRCLSTLGYPGAATASRLAPGYNPAVPPGRTRGGENQLVIVEHLAPLTKAIFISVKLR